MLLRKLRVGFCASAGPSVAGFDVDAEFAMAAAGHRGAGTSRRDDDPLSEAQLFNSGGGWRPCLKRTLYVSARRTRTHPMQTGRAQPSALGAQGVGCSAGGGDNGINRVLQAKVPTLTVRNRVPVGPPCF